MKTVDGKLNFITEKLFVSAGYYGSFFGNDFGNVTPSVPNQLRGPTGLVATLTRRRGRRATILPGARACRACCSSRWRCRRTTRPTRST